MKSTTTLYASPTTALAVRTWGPDFVAIGSADGLMVLEVATDALRAWPGDPALGPLTSQLAIDPDGAGMWAAQPGQLVHLVGVPE